MLARVLECVGLTPFFTLCFSYVCCSNIQLYGCSLRHTFKSSCVGLVYSLIYFLVIPLPTLLEFERI